MNPNILLITADDMNYDSPGATGNRTPGITPNLDRLASEGMRFVHSHVTIAVCQPSRSVLMTGRFPHRNGAMGFESIWEHVPTLQEQLSNAGYFNGIMAKVGHLHPEWKFCWDFVVKAKELGIGRSPSLYYQRAKDFFDQAKQSGKPFFLMANSQDPHRPFAGSDQEKNREKRSKLKFPPASRHYRAEEVDLPGFLPDIPDVRKEVAEYYSSVHRCDETVGSVLRALEESGLEDNTLVMFLSDNGMALPFAKTNCYLASTRTPWIARWPGRIEEGVVEDRHIISGIDYMPTILEAAGIGQIPGMDGRSFVPVLEGKGQEGRDLVFTQFHQTAGKRDYPMRCVQNRRFGYIYNAWADEQTVFLNESQSGRSFEAMQAAAKTNKEIADRVRLFQYRVPEEFYDFQNDPCALNNLIDSPECAQQVLEMRSSLLKMLKDTEDPIAGIYEHQVFA